MNKKVVLGIMALVVASGIGAAVFFKTRKKTSDLQDTVIGEQLGEPEKPVSVPYNPNKPPPPRGLNKVKTHAAILLQANKKFPPPRFKKAKKEAYKNYINTKMQEAGFTLKG